jgi:glycerol uptake facilitator-like aquaporin
MFSVSGAHFNPVVSAVSAWDGRLSGCNAVVYVAQTSGAFMGVAAAHGMFGLPIVQISAHLRPTLGEGLGELIATFGLVLVIVSSRGDPDSNELAIASPPITTSLGAYRHEAKAITEESQSLIKTRLRSCCW